MLRHFGLLLFACTYGYVYLYYKHVSVCMCTVKEHLTSQERYGLKVAEGDLVNYQPAASASSPGDQSKDWGPGKRCAGTPREGDQCVCVCVCKALVKQQNPTTKRYLVISQGNTLKVTEFHRTRDGLALQDTEKYTFKENIS